MSRVNFCVKKPQKTSCGFVCQANCLHESYFLPRYLLNISQIIPRQTNIKNETVHICHQLCVAPPPGSTPEDPNMIAVKSPTTYPKSVHITTFLLLMNTAIRRISKPIKNKIVDHCLFPYKKKLISLQTRYNTTNANTLPIAQQISLFLDDCFAIACPFLKAELG